MKAFHFYNSLAFGPYYVENPGTKKMFLKIGQLAFAFDTIGNKSFLC